MASEFFEEEGIQPSAVEAMLRADVDPQWRREAEATTRTVRRRILELSSDGKTVSDELAHSLAEDCAFAGMIHVRDSIFIPTLSTLLAGPHGPTVVCAVPGRVAAPSPLNIRISYEQTGDCLFSRTREMFTKLVTANPELETIVEPEVVHMIDTVYEFTFCKYGVINYDKVYRDHCG